MLKEAQPGFAQVKTLMGTEELCGEAVSAEPCRINVINSRNLVFGEELGFKPYVGLEFETSEDAYEFYKSYSLISGFTVRVGQLSRSKLDGSITSRKYVCSKEGLQRRFTSGCLACLRVKKQNSGKWVVDRFQNDHNHDPELQKKSSSHGKPGRNLSSPVNTLKTLQDGTVEVRSVKEADVETCHVGISKPHTQTREGEGESKFEPYVGMEFVSPEEARDFYCTYAQNSGFKVRTGQLTRSNTDDSVVIRRYVCWKEGFHLASRVGCRALIRIKKHESGKWVLDRFHKDHNHNFNSHDEVHLVNKTCNLSPAPSSMLALPSSEMLSLKMISNLEETGAGVSSAYKVCCVNKHRRSNIGSDWYHVILEYLRNEQARDPGFFYALEVDDGRCMSIFWADSRSRFSCSQFGDVVVFDTRYRTSSYVVPFASFVGVNHHKQPVLLGCAMVADDSKESFTWLFETWHVAMSGCRPLSIIADQDKVIRHVVEQVFPGTNYCFSMWHIKDKEREKLGHVHAMHKSFKCEYDSCINNSQTPSEFIFAWEALLERYQLKENEWLKELYEDREMWVPLYTRGTFLAGISTSGSENSFFGTLLNSGTPLKEFISRYERALEQRRGEEQKEDLVTTQKHMLLLTKEPMEKQCEQIYTRNAFLRFQKELIECRNFSEKKIDEGIICRYLVYEHEDEEEKDIVVFSCSNLEVSCSCLMFESEGFLCKHILRVFQALDITEVPSRYILRRWTRYCEYGTIPDVQSLRSYQECITSMVWSLRKEACKFIELGTMSLERHDFAFNVLQQGRIKLATMRTDVNYPSLEQTGKKKKQKM